VSFGAELQGLTARHRTDSTGTFYGLRNGGFATLPGSDLNLLVKKIWAVASVCRIRLQPEYVGKYTASSAPGRTCSRAKCWTTRRG
jgi:hypothetical protein